MLPTAVAYADPPAPAPAPVLPPLAPVVPETPRAPLTGTFANITACAVPTAPPDATLSVRPDIVYSSAGGESQKLDVVGPATGSNKPMVMLIHGGGWRHGERNDDSLRFTARVLAGQGFVAATASYRLTQNGVQNLFPAGVADARCAIRWLRSNAVSYGGDPNRIAVIGLSAGGHLASMLGTAREESRLDDGSCPISSNVSPGVQGVVAYYPPTNLSLCAASANVCLLSVTSFLGVAPIANPTLATFASPMTYVSADDPPFLFVHGARDDAVVPQQSQTMRDALKAKGVAVGYVEVPNAGHAFPVLAASPSVLGDASYQTETCTTLGFLRAVFGLS